MDAVASSDDKVTLVLCLDMLTHQQVELKYNVKAVLDDYFKKSRQRCTAHVVHRLDRDTSGLMIYAKDMETEQILEHNWHDIVFDRRYVAVLSGEMEEDEGTIENWLKDNKAYVTYSSPVDNGGKYAITHFRTLDRKDAAAIGFDDDFIYKELELAPEKRNKPSEIILRDEASKAFRMWMEKSDKTEY